MLQNNIEILKQWIRDSNNIVFFGGAGVSTESGIPDFRSTDGLYHLKYSEKPETILSHSYFMNHTKEFYDFYRDKMIYLDAQPNITHKKLAELEANGKLKAIVTQNIDDLHKKAGSNMVLELHGSILRNHCLICKKEHGLETIINSTDIPRCDCQGIIKPDVVLYEEALEDQVIREAIKIINKAEVLIIGGTSLSVYPAAGLIQYYQGNKLVLINKDDTPYDNKSDLLIKAKLGDVFTLL